MKKGNPRKVQDDLRDEYDPALIRKGVRGKYAAAYRAGTNLVLLAPDVATAFPTTDAVNDALRLLMRVAGSIRKDVVGGNTELESRIEEDVYEHSAAAISRGEIARQQYRLGEFRPLSRQSGIDRLSKANATIKSLFERYEAAIRKFEEPDAVTRRRNNRGFSFFVDGRRFATISIRPGKLRIWLKLTPGTLHDPRGRSHTTKVAHTIRDIRDDHDFDYILGLVKQAYRETN